MRKLLCSVRSSWLQSRNLMSRAARVLLKITHRLTVMVGGSLVDLSLVDVVILGYAVRFRV